MNRPNFIVFMGEDTGRHQGCYGDLCARTPNIDRLAREGCRFTNAISTAPVCSPSRATIVTGRFQTSICTHNHRSVLLQPPRLFTEDLRQAGYFVNWANKTDFNFEPPAAFADERSDWVSAAALPAQPFLLYYNFGGTHESGLWPPGAKPDVEPPATEGAFAAERLAGVPVPPYLPDTDVTRAAIVRYHDHLRDQDAAVGRILELLAKSGHGDNTYVLYFSDHGRGLPREKRWLYEAGIHLPLIIRGPGIAPDSRRDDLISWVDLAPTILSLAGVEVPADYDGRSILGPAQGPEPACVFAARDRMDEGFDRSRAARDRRYLYIRNLSPSIAWAQRLQYQETSPVMRQLRELHAADALSYPDNVFMADGKPEVELYDTAADPHCVCNLAEHPALAAVRARLAGALDDWCRRCDTYGQQDERGLVAQGLVVDQTDKDAAWLKSLPAALRRGGRFDTVQFAP